MALLNSRRYSTRGIWTFVLGVECVRIVVVDVYDYLNIFPFSSVEGKYQVSIDFQRWC